MAAKKLSSANRTPIWAALIGAAALIIAASIGIIWSHNKSPGSKDSDLKGDVSYTGRVTDAHTGSPVRNATVTIEEDQSVQTQVTDQDGYFHVSLKQDAKTVRVRLGVDGYEKFDRIVSLTRTGIEPIQLKPTSSNSGSSPEPSKGTGKRRNSSAERQRKHDEAVNALYGTGEKRKP
jgi:hypothetical protein